MNDFSCSNQTNINQENTKNYPFTVKNKCEFIKNDNILEKKTRVLLLESSLKSHVTSKREYQQRQDGGTK